MVRAANGRQPLGLFTPRTCVKKPALAGSFLAHLVESRRLPPYVLIRVGNLLCRVSFTSFFTSPSWTLSFEHQTEQRDLCDIYQLVFTALPYYQRLIGGQDVKYRKLNLLYYCEFCFQKPYVHKCICMHMYLCTIYTIRLSVVHPQG